MNSVNRTLYIPLRGKAYVSQRGIILKDETAEEIWTKEQFPLRGKSASKWLAFYMAMRARVFDRWTEVQMTAHPHAAVLHLGCGLDSRVRRVGNRGGLWYDVDFPDVIRERRRYFSESEQYVMLGADLREQSWLDRIEGERAIVILEGVSMYLPPEELAGLLQRLQQRFSEIWLLMDCYSEFAARASRVKNPINDVGVTQVWGMEEPERLAGESGMTFVGEHTMTPEDLIRQLSRLEQPVFRRLYAGWFAGKLYRLYEFH